MRFYLMARYGRRAEMLQVASELEAMGHTVTSRWGKPPAMFTLMRSPIGPICLATYGNTQSVVTR